MIYFIYDKEKFSGKLYGMRKKVKMDIDEVLEDEDNSIDRNASD